MGVFGEVAIGLLLYMFGAPIRAETGPRKVLGIGGGSLKTHTKRVENSVREGSYRVSSKSMPFHSSPKSVFQTAIQSPASKSNSSSDKA